MSVYDDSESTSRAIANPRPPTPRSSDDSFSDFEDHTHPPTLLPSSDDSFSDFEDLEDHTTHLPAPPTRVYSFSDFEDLEDNTTPPTTPPTPDAILSITNETITYGEIPYEGGTYVGFILNGVPHVYGTLSYVDDVTYEGNWHKGQEHGQGSVRWKHGLIYEGTFVFGQPDGCGFIRNVMNPGNTKLGWLVGAKIQYTSV